MSQREMERFYRLSARALRPGGLIYDTPDVNPVSRPFGQETYREDVMARVFARAGLQSLGGGLARKPPHPVDGTLR
jgi:hypothetical protein